MVRVRLDGHAFALRVIALVSDIGYGVNKRYLLLRVFDAQSDIGYAGTDGAASFERKTDACSAAGGHGRAY